MPGIEIQDISLEENTQLFEKLVQGFGKLGVVTKLLNHKHPRIHKLINSFACIRDKSQDQPRFIQTKPDWSNKTGLIQIKSD